MVAQLEKLVENKPDGKPSVLFFGISHIHIVLPQIGPQEWAGEVAEPQRNLAHKVVEFDRPQLELQFGQMT